jgi:hypothetical protein
MILLNNLQFHYHGKWLIHWVLGESDGSPMWPRETSCTSTMETSIRHSPSPVRYVSKTYLSPRRYGRTSATKLWLEPLELLKACYVIPATGGRHYPVMVVKFAGTIWLVTVGTRAREQSKG